MNKMRPVGRWRGIAPCHIRALAPALLLALVIPLPACSTDGGSAAGEDASITADAAVRADAGVRVDAGAADATGWDLTEADAAPDAAPDAAVPPGPDVAPPGDTGPLDATVPADAAPPDVLLDAAAPDVPPSDTAHSDDASAAGPDTVAADTVQVDAVADTTTDAEPAPDDALYVLSGGAVDPIWGASAHLSAFDSEHTVPYGDCTDEAAGTESCPSVDWEIVSEPGHGDVLEVRYAPDAGHAGMVVGPLSPVDVSAFAGGSLEIEIKIQDAGLDGLSGGLFLKVESGGATSGELPVSGITASGEWESIVVPVSSLTASGALDLSGITAPFVFFPAFGTAPGLVYRLGDVRFTGAEPVDPPTGPFELTHYGAGTVSDRFNPEGYGCVEDYGTWIYNAGVVEPGVASCSPIGEPTPREPQVVGNAASGPTPTHRWWGSISFLGEMTVGEPQDAAYITPDPLTVRISDRGARIMGIPAGLGLTGDGFLYQIPDPFSEVFDGIAVGNSDHADLDAYLLDHSDGSATVQWRSGEQPVMEATFVHGSPHAWFVAFEGDLVLRTLRADGAEKGTFYQQENSLGVWTDVAGNRNHFLVTGEGETTFLGADTAQITVQNAARELTVTWLPDDTGTPGGAMIADFAATARARVAAVDIDYIVDRATNTVTITHSYRDDTGELIETMAGLHPLQWKRSDQQTSGHATRSARGVIRFARTSRFTYALPFVGVLPHLPSGLGDADPATLEALVQDFVSGGAAVWNTATDTYWAGKSYGKVAELAAIARSIGMTQQADQLLDWLKAELADWFTATTGSEWDTTKYFVYDERWNTLLGVEESFSSHQQLNDHHFHYGYFVRAAAEICRVDRSWCAADQYGPMVELLIQDYAGGRADPLFPYLRHFDPANGFSWASGAVNFALGNNNESTSEAANAYGAMVLYGLVTEDDALVERGMYLHASTAATYWEYWNDIDGYRGATGEYVNFPAGYDRLTTSIIWGQGAVFATWFSAAYAHILGIQGLPANPLILHVGLHADYMEDYVALGLSESSNGRPSGLPGGHWRDIWWNLWALTDADAALADYETVGASYAPEDGETRAHTYHWLHAFRALGHLATGTGDLTADHPTALAFSRDSQLTYVVYNFSDAPLTVTYSDGQTVTAAPRGFTVTDGR